MSLWSRWNLFGNDETAFVVPLGTYTEEIRCELTQLNKSSNN